MTHSEIRSGKDWGVLEGGKTTPNLVAISLVLIKPVKVFDGKLVSLIKGWVGLS